MEAFAVLEKSYYVVNRDFDFYKQKFGHTYYLSVNEEETTFIDKLFKKADKQLSAQDRMLNYSISAIYTAMTVLIEYLKRNNIIFSDSDLEEICVGFSQMKKNDINFKDKTENELDEILFGLLTDGIDLDSRKKSGSERTPDEIIQYMLEIIGYDKEVSNCKSIVDPACGTGTFIKQITQKFIEGLQVTDSVTEKLLMQRLIRAYDTKPSNVFVTKIVIIETLIAKKIVKDISVVCELMKGLPIYCEDFLHTDEKADFVIGNPPYIRLQNLPLEYRDYIKSNYASATGRFDIFTCFMEHSDKILSEHGRMCLITSNKYLTANYGVGIRDYLSRTGHVRKIIDLFDTKFFGAAVLPAIIMCENVSEKDADVEYIGIKTSTHRANAHCKNATELFDFAENKMISDKVVVSYGVLDDIILEIARATVKIPINGKTWNFLSEDENDIKLKMDKNKQCSLKDLFDICVGIKTTADTVFVKPMTEEFINDHKFENDAIYPLIQSFDVNRWQITWGENKKDRYILYPHREKDGNMQAIPLNEIPNAASYLLEQEETLRKRTYLTESKTREWYECWVPQKLSKFQQTKIVTRDIVSTNSFALDESGRLCQGNTFFLTKKDSIFSIDFAGLDDHQYYCFILGILNSKAMEYYQKMISGCLYSQKYRYTTSNLNRWPIPKVNLHNALKIAKYVDEIISGSAKKDELESKIDILVYNEFDLNQDDIEKIEKLVSKSERMTA